MIVSVIYYDETAKAYAGRHYTYLTGLPLKLFEKVKAPVLVNDEIVLKKALVVDIDLPESVIDPAWADRVRIITERDQEA